jgi:hypothetical protein
MRGRTNSNGKTTTARRTSTASSRNEPTEATGEKIVRQVDAVNGLPTRRATKFEPNDSLNCCMRRMIIRDELARLKDMDDFDYSGLGLAYTSRIARTGWNAGLD